MAKDENKAGEAAEEKAAAEKKAADDALVKKCCDAYGIPAHCVFASGVKNGVATVVTAGGARVRLGEGDDPKKAERLSPIQVSGINPEWKKPNIVAGKRR